MNIYEQWVFDKLESEEFAVFTPYKDRGVDCIVTHRHFGGIPQRIQIKGSRTHRSRTHEGGVGWFQANAKALARGKTITDFWIFVWTKDERGGRLEPIFLICPTAALSDRLRRYARAPQGKYDIYLRHRRVGGDDVVFDTRNDPDPSDPNRNYSTYFQNWQRL